MVHTVGSIPRLSITRHTESAKPELIGPEERFWCRISQSWCLDECDHCLPWLVTCDRCYVPGHTDSGWRGYLVGPGAIRCLCHSCYEIEGGEAKEEEQERLWGGAQIGNS